MYYAWFVVLRLNLIQRFRAFIYAHAMFSKWPIDGRLEMNSFGIFGS